MGRARTKPVQSQNAFLLLAVNHRKYLVPWEIFQYCASHWNHKFTASSPASIFCANSCSVSVPSPHYHSPSAKSAGGKLQLNMRILLTQQSQRGLNMVSTCMVWKSNRETSSHTTHPGMLCNIISWWLILDLKEWNWCTRADLKDHFSTTTKKRWWAMI